jgi:hypothetical protein
MAINEYGVVERELAGETKENSEKTRRVRLATGKKRQEEREVRSSETSVNFDYSSSDTGHRC